MNKILSVFVLVSSVFSGINNGLIKAQIPQGSFQQIYIEGDSNKVTQQLNQRINLNFVDIPEIENSVIANLNIQGTFLDNLNNSVNQEINQNVLNSSLISLSLNTFKLNDFIGYDNILNGLQFSEQQAFIRGDSNFTNQLSDQFLTNFFLLEPSDQIIKIDYFNQFLGELLDSNLLDSFQFSSQDTLLFGNNNIVYQNITQRIDIFLFLPPDFTQFFETETWIDENFLNPTQLTIQETFIKVTENNIITQNINQSINNISFKESGLLTQDNELLSEFETTDTDSETLAYFPIDTFIDEILNNTIIESKQINSQFLEVIGNSNKNIQENEQLLDLMTNEELSEFTINEQELLASIPSVPEPSNLRIMLVLLAIMGIRWWSIFLKLNLLPPAS